MVNAHVHQKLTHFIIYKVAKNLNVQKSLHKSFGSPWPSNLKVIYLNLNVSNVYNNYLSVLHLNLLSVWCF